MISRYSYLGISDATDGKIIRVMNREGDCINPYRIADNDILELLEWSSRCSHLRRGLVERTSLSKNLDGPDLLSRGFSIEQFDLELGCSGCGEIALECCGRT